MRLRHALGRREVTKTLSTLSPRVARRRAASIVTVVLRLFNFLTEHAATMDERQFDRVRQLLDEYLRDELVADDRRAALRAPRDPDEQRDYEDALSNVLDDFAEALRLNDLSVVRNVVRDFVDHRLRAAKDLGDVDLSDGSDAWRMISREMLKGQVFLWHALVRRAQGEIVDAPQPLAASSAGLHGAAREDRAAAPQKPLSGLSLSAGFEACAAFKRKTSSWTEETAKEHRAVVRLAIDSVGDVDVAAIDPSLARQIIDALVSAPANASKGSTKPPSKTTVAKRVAFLRSVFKWLESQHYVEGDPFAKLSAAVPKADKKKREGFTTDQLRAMAGALPRDPEHPSRFWLIPLALHTGARLAELTALRVDDFEMREGISCILIRPRDDRRLKTEAAERVVPVHPTLIDMGLLQFVDARRAEAGREAQLFPDICPVQGDWAHEPSKWFARFRRNVGITSSRQPFHATRNTVISAMLEGGVQLHVVQHVVGHAVSGNVTTGRYAAKPSYGTLRDAINRITYEVAWPRAPA
jgi:integrase